MVLGEVFVYVGKGGIGAVRTGGQVARTLVCQKSSLSRGGDFFGNHLSAMCVRRSGLEIASARTLVFSSLNCKSTTEGPTGAHSLGAKPP